MTIEHLRDEELDLALAGETLPAEAAQHLASCVACRRRRDAFLAAVEAAGAEPAEATRRRVREGALAAWSGSSRRHWLRWAAAAAAVVLALLPLLRRAPAPKLNPDAVLVQVDAILAQDPLAAVAPEDVVNTVAPIPATNGEGS